MTKRFDGGHSYLNAGADVLFIEAPESEEELREISSAFPDAWLLANMVEGGRTPSLSAEELEELGYIFIVFPVSALFAATAAMERCLNHLKKYKSTTGYCDKIWLKDFEKIIDVPKFRELEKKFGRKKRVQKNEFYHLSKRNIRNYNHNSASRRQ